MKKIRRVAALLLVLSLLSAHPYGAHASSDTRDIRVIINGRILHTAVAPEVRQGTTLVSVRDVAERLGARIDYGGSKQSMQIRLGRRVILLHTERAYGVVDGRIIPLGAPPTVRDGVTLVPIRFISEAFDAAVFYSAATHTAQIHFHPRSVRLLS